MRVHCEGVPNVVLSSRRLQEGLYVPVRLASCCGTIADLGSSAESCEQHAVVV